MGTPGSSRVETSGHSNSVAKVVATCALFLHILEVLMTGRFSFTVIEHSTASS